MQNQKYALKRNEALLERAKKIFGENIVADAFIGVATYSWMAEDYVVEEVEAAVKKYHLDDIQTQLNLDDSNVFIKMMNGNMLHFSNSEWGAITLFDSNDIALVVN